MSTFSFLRDYFKISILFIVFCFVFGQRYSNAANSERANEEIKIEFSHLRKLYNQPFTLTLHSSSTNATIIYTLDCSTPSATNGINYSDGIQIDSTIIVKAIAITSGEVSPVFTNSYIFPSTSSKQGKNPIGFPETWGGAKIISADYEMDSAVINSPDYSDKITDAFESLPSLSLSMNTDEWFNHETGLYVGYENSNITREKPVTAEFIFNNNEENFVIECGVQNQGGTSIVKWKSPKQSMRLLFKEEYGPTRLNYKLFHDSEINSINTLVVDAMLNATWIHPFDDKQRLHALYLRDQLTSDLQNEMGSLSFHGRYFHLYLNGLYWGICNLHERPDDAFLSEYLDASREDFDVIKHEPDNIVSGSNSFYLLMLESARKGFETYQNLKNFERYLDLPAFIDYMILNFYLGNQDWAQHNYYAAKNRMSPDGFRYYSWDSEHVIRFADVQYDNTGKNNEGAPTEIHTLLKSNEEYRIMFADAVYKHLFNKGALTPANFEKIFRARVKEIEQAVILESARWGDYRKDISFITYTKNEYWIPEVNKVLNEYIPQRRDIVIGQLRDTKNMLFPKYMPPIIESKEIGNGEKEITLISQNSSSDFIYYTVDGKDPRQVGGGINGTKYTGKFTIGNSSILKTRFYSSGDDIWSALAEELFLFDDVYGEHLVINEIMYHPEDEKPEFIEIMNFGESPVNLNGFSFSKGISYLFNTDEYILPGTGIVLSNDNALFKNTYDFDAFGQYQKQLSNKGESLLLINGFNQLVDSVTYSDTIPWPESADGAGYSLVLKDPVLDNALWSSWRASDNIGGSPYNNGTNLDALGELFPNPFSDLITIKLSGDRISTEVFNIDVYNQLGRKIKSIKTNSYNSRIQINLGEVLPGMYFIRVNANKNTQFEGVVLKAIKLI